jgi:RND family efflux transporter MFP subunit
MLQQLRKTQFGLSLLGLSLLPGILPSALNAAELASFTVTQGEITRERLFDGVVEAINQTTVSAQTGGRIIEINFDIDDKVDSGAVLLKISDNEQSASAAQAAASISQMQAQLTQARNNFARYKKLLASQTISRSEYDQAKTTLDSAIANLNASRAAKDQAQKQVDYTVVRAPYSGIVTERLVDLGETVSPGQPLMSGFSTRLLRVRTEVPNRFARQIDAERGVDIVLDTPTAERIHSTRVTVFPFANTRSNSVTVRADLPEDTDSVYPGMLTKVAFQTARESRILIPLSAIFVRSELTGIYVLEGDAIYLRRLSIGRPYTDDQGVEQVEVLNGLKLGEQVAVDPVAAVKRLKQSQQDALKATRDQER